ncbi:hybrid sensor histidine kinase/response regulator [Sorangium sp. So ce854]|uniref:hybrid sensor histidine kinase/response regulator n=1 Tax=Sorangium sp. So ce854 TaxID=3133322 RepID=UPI003F61B8A5
MKLPLLRLPLNYGLAVLTAAAVVAAGAALQSTLGPAAPMALFAVAVLVSARVGGVGPGLVSTALTMAGAAYFFIEPIHALWVDSLADAVWLALFGLFGVFFSLLMEQMHRARDRIQAALGLLELRDRALASASCGIVITDPRRPGNPVVYVNAGFERLTGYPCAEVLGQRLDILEGPDTDAAATAARRDAEAHRRPCRITLLHYRKNATTFWDDALLAPIHGPSGEVTHLVSVLNDITRLKSAEVQLRESEERLRLATEGAAIGIWSCDSTSGRVTCTPLCQELLGIEGGEPTSYERFLGALYDDDREALRASIEGALREGAPFRIECRTLAPAGGARWVALPGRAFSYEGGGAPRVMGAVFDVTAHRMADEAMREQQRALAQLLEAERAARNEAERAARMKDEFVATLSHELRTPLNAVLGWAQILRRHRRDAEETARGLAVVERNARALAQLIDDLLDVSRAVAGKLRIELDDVDLRSIVASVVTSLQPSADAKGIALACSFASGAAMVRGDPRRLQQITWNLLSNAIKFTPQGGRVDVSLRRSGGRVALVVRDTGQGISREFLPHLFDRFRQADASTARQHGGLGLGLSLVKHFAELHQGAVFAESEGVGRGAAFIVELPMTTAAAAPEAPPGAAPPGGAAAGLAGVKVLVVDDDGDARDFTERLLREHEVDVLAVGSASSALDALPRFRPDVLLCDIGMPERDGYWFMREVRKLGPERGGGTPAVALTAFARIEDRERAYAAGFQEHITKPVDLAAVVNAVARLARRAAA